jgi:hypothetical protein
MAWRRVRNLFAGAPAASLNPVGRIERSVITIHAMQGQEPPIVEFINILFGISRDAGGAPLSEDPAVVQNRIVLSKTVSTDGSMHTFRYFWEQRERLVLQVVYVTQAADMPAMIYPDKSAASDAKPIIYFKIDGDGTSANLARTSLIKKYTAQLDTFQDTRELEIGDTEITMETNALKLKIVGFSGP